MAKPKKYELTDEHRAQLEPWAKKWISNAMSTAPMTEVDRKAMRVAVRGLYEAAHLTPPPTQRIVFVPSPFVARFAGGFAAAIWWLRKNSWAAAWDATGDATWDATEAATEAATGAATGAATEAATEAATGAATGAATEAATEAAAWDATGDATWDATEAATRDATEAATWDATGAATWDATEAATWDATRDATRAATWDATRDATRAATGAATRDATGAATWDATEAATWDATRDATEAATRDATWAATGDATGDATRDATEAATWDATGAATRDATWDATRAATGAATRAATGAATRDATGDATWDATEAATGAATWAALKANPEHQNYENWWSGIPLQALRSVAAAFVPSRVPLLLQCAANAYNMWDGGNQWSGYPSFLSFFRHVAGLTLDYSKWQHYEAACIHGGPRVMHAEFCIISDRPVRLLVDAQNRPHCENGPFCAWSDGTALWAWHGVRVPAWIIRSPERITPERISSESNAEVRRVMIERMGWDKWLTAQNAVPVQCDRYGDLYRTTLDGAEIGIVVVTNSTPEADGSSKRYALVCEPKHRTAHAAVAASFGLTPDTYAPSIES